MNIVTININDLIKEIDRVPLFYGSLNKIHRHSAMHPTVFTAGMEDSGGPRLALGARRAEAITTPFIGCTPLLTSKYFFSVSEALADAPSATSRHISSGLDVS